MLVKASTSLVKEVKLSKTNQSHNCQRGGGDGAPHGFNSLTYVWNEFPRRSETTPYVKFSRVWLSSCQSSDLSWTDHCLDIKVSRRALVENHENHTSMTDSKILVLGWRPHFFIADGTHVYPQT